MLNLKNFRNQYGLSQRQFCEIAGIKRGTYSNYELGIRTPSNSNMIKIEKAMKKIETKNNKESALDRLQAQKSYNKIEEYYKNPDYHDAIDLEFLEEQCRFRWKYVILFIILLFIFAVLF